MPEAGEKVLRLLAAIDRFAESAYGSETDQELANDRALAIERYLGRNINPAPAGRSQVRDRTTFEVVEWTKPSLLRIFTAGNEVCKFDPVGPEDEEQAAQETDYVNFVILQRNNWHQVAADLISDGLLLKNGYVYAYWDETKATESEFYENLTDDAFALIAGDKEIEIVGHSERPDEETNERNAAAFQQAQQQYAQMAQQAMMQAQQTGQPPQLPPPPQPPQPALLHDCEIKRTFKRGQVKICTIAPERCLVDMNTPDHTLEGAHYFEWFDYKTIGELRASGFDVADDIGDSGDGINRWDSPEESARDLYNENNWGVDDNTGINDPSSRRVKVRYIWVRYDYDGDGINELQYCVVVGHTLLYRREAEEIPVASFSPIPLAHRHVGMSLADSVADIEDINTDITRQAINNLNLSNTPRIAVSDRVNMSDLLDVRVGGVIRVDGQPPQEFLPVTVPNVFPDAMVALNYFDTRRQNRTGINAYFQGTDANTLNKTASGISQLTNSAAQRVELIARHLASCVERLFLIVHRLILQHGHANEVVKLRNKWVTVDPAQWRKRTDVKISVGLGTGNKDSQLAQLLQMFQVQMAVIPMGVAAPPNLYATVMEIAKTAGFATPEKFVNDPVQNPPPPAPPPPEIMVEQMRSQVTVQSKQAELQSKERMEQLQAQLTQWKTEQDNMLKRYLGELDAQVKLVLADKQGELEVGKLQVEREMEGAKLVSAENIKAAELSKTEEEQMEADALKGLMQQVDELKNAIVQVVQGMDGKRAVGVERVRDPRTGKMIGAKVMRADGSTEDITIQ